MRLKQFIIYIYNQYYSSKIYDYAVIRGLEIFYIFSQYVWTERKNAGDILHNKYGFDN